MKGAYPKPLLGFHSFGGSVTEVHRFREATMYSSGVYGFRIQDSGIFRVFEGLGKVYRIFCCTWGPIQQTQLGAQVFCCAAHGPFGL